MSIVQRTYETKHDPLAEGQIADAQTYDVRSLYLAGAGDVPFGRAVQKSTVAAAGDKDIELGAHWAPIGVLSADITAGANSLTLDAAIADGVLPQGSLIRIANELIQVGDSSAAGATYAITRGRGGTAGAAHAEDAVVRSAVESTFRGISIIDYALPAANGAVYKTADIVSAMVRGEVAVRVSGAVTEGDQVVAATVASGTGANAEAVGQLSSKPADGTHVLLRGARFIRSAAAGGLSVVRLAGPVPA